MARNVRWDNFEVTEADKECLAKHFRRTRSPATLPELAQCAVEGRLEAISRNSMATPGRASTFAVMKQFGFAITSALRDNLKNSCSESGGERAFVRYGDRWLLAELLWPMTPRHKERVHALLERSSKPLSVEKICKEISITDAGVVTDRCAFSLEFSLSQWKDSVQRTRHGTWTVVTRIGNGTFVYSHGEKPTINSAQTRKVNAAKKSTYTNQPVILISRRGTAVSAGGRCDECQASRSYLWRYAESNCGTVFICGQCKPEVFNRSFGHSDAMNLARLEGGMGL